MQIDCPHGRKTVARLGNITLEDTTVEILGGVCDAAHYCDIKSCKFYDVSPAGDAKFTMALAQGETLEGYLETITEH